MDLGSARQRNPGNAPGEVTGGFAQQSGKYGFIRGDTDTISLGDVNLVTAHEIGHTLGANHIDFQNDLMTQSTQRP